MALPNVMQTGRSGMVAAKAQMGTTSHNISNANTEGYSRQRTNQVADTAHPHGSKSFIGTGVLVDRTERVNDQYLEKQIRNVGRELGHLEEKEVALKQAEDIFNEMGGDGLNRLVAKFFNDFRKLANDPDSEAVRVSVRESSQAMINDFKRLRSQVEELRYHLDARLEGQTRELNDSTEQLRDINNRIKILEAGGAPANDLLDQRDAIVRKLNSYLDISTHTDKDGAIQVDLKGVGPIVNGPNAEKFSVERTKADADGKGENSLTLNTTASASGNVTHRITGGKIGAILEVRDQVLNGVLNRLDDLAYSITDSVNQVHSEGFTRKGVKGVLFFEPTGGKERAAGNLKLSAAIQDDVNNIATAAAANSPSDNRVAVAISQIQNMRLMNDGQSTLDDFYNSIVGDVGVAASRSATAINQQKDVQSQLNKLREQVSGVSIDEETANLLQFQHAFDASAKVIQVADECLKTVLELRR